MRKHLIACALGASLGLAAPAMADSNDYTPESYAYLSWNFGGSAPAGNAYAYGLRLDHDQRFVDRRMPSIVELDFAGRTNHLMASVSGIPVLSRSFMMRQTEGEAEAPIEGVEEEVAAEDGAAAEDDGWFSGVKGFFTDMGTGTKSALIAGGAVVAYVVLSDDDAKSKPGDGGDGGSGGEEPPAEECPIPVDPITGLCLLLTGDAGSHELTAQDVERIEWLDGGNGHMGDLIER